MSSEWSARTVNPSARRLPQSFADEKFDGVVYWLGLDENIDSKISYPTQQRVLEIFATAAAMGATTVRSTTLGVSTGHPLSVEPSLGVFNEDALKLIDYAIAVARR